MRAHVLAWEDDQKLGNAVHVDEIRAMKSLVQKWASHLAHARYKVDT